MNRNADLALGKQAFDQLLRLCEPATVKTWKPTLEQKAEYVRLAEVAVSAVEELQALEQRQLLVDGQLHSSLPESQLAFVRDQISPRIDDIRAAADFLDPEGKALRDLLHWFNTGPSGAGKGVRATFDQGVQEVHSLLDRNPDWEDDRGFRPALAEEVLESKLIRFEPDSWLDRAGELTLVRTDKRNFSLPGHVRIRLEELYRAYIFGMWLSVLALSRAILEYAILDNLFKFKIEATWPPERGQPCKPKKLAHLIDEVSDHLPEQKESMELVRSLGNDYLHPKQSRPSKELLFECQSNANRVVPRLVEVLEAIYLAPKK
jgi:hypothetical protein